MRDTLNEQRLRQSSGLVKKGSVQTLAFVEVAIEQKRDTTVSVSAEHEQGSRRHRAKVSEALASHEEYVTGRGTLPSILYPQKQRLRDRTGVALRCCVL